jgi:hypothetical protein
MSHALDLAIRFVKHCYPDAEASVLAGSQAREERMGTSDYYVVLLFHSLPDGAWREMTTFEGQHMEVFAYDLETLTHFCQDIDRPSGVPALPAMVAEGVAIWSRVPRTLDAAREIGRETLRLGPPPLDEAALRDRRFAITDLAVALESGRDEHVLLAAGAALYGALADFALGAGNHWSATGKAFPRALTAMDRSLANHFGAAFGALFAARVTAPVQVLVDKVLAPYGGRLREGFCQGRPRRLDSETQVESPGPNPG